MRRRVAAIGLLLLSVGCAGSAGTARTAAPDTAADAGDATLRVLAGILRAEDRGRADDDLRAALSASEPALRARAVVALARIEGAAGEALAAALGDASPEVRSAAAFAAGRVGDPALAGPLSGRAGDRDPQVREAVARALGKLAGEDALTALETLLEDPEPEVRVAAVDAFGGVAEPSRSVERLTGLTGPGDARVRRAAARELARVGSGVPGARGGDRAEAVDLATRGRARAHLQTLIDDLDPMIRMQVATGLAVPATRPERNAMRRLASDPDRRVRIAVARSLAVPNAHLDILGTLLRRDSDLHVRWTVLQSLGQLGRLASEVLVDRVINLKNPWLRERAVVSLNEADPPIASRAANSLSLDESPGVRVATAGSLIGVRTPDAAVVVERLLGDTDPAVRAAILPALAAELGPVADRLDFAARDPHAVVRAAAAGVAGQRLSTRITDDAMVDDAMLLLERIWEGSGGGGAEVLVRREVLDQAVRGGASNRVRALLMRALDDPEWSVRSAAARHVEAVLGEPRPATAGPDIDLPLERYVEILRWASRPRAAVVTVEREGFTPGRFTIRLDTANAPMTAWHFARLAGQGFYDGTEVHRVIPNFILQDGDRTGDGYGAADTWLRERHGPSRFDAGTMAMMSHGPDLVGSQWFVTLTDQPGLAGRYTAFGNVVQNFPGVVSLVIPGDRIVSIEIYEGDGSEPLPPLPQ